MPQQHPVRSTPSRPSRPDASMSLLNNVMDHSLDDGYAEAAARRGETGTARLPRTVRGKLGLAGGLILAALVVTLGAAQAQESAPTLAKERGALIKRIEKASAEADRTQREVQSLRKRLDTSRSRALKAHGGDSETKLMSLLSGATPVTGPGVKLVLDDAKDAEQGQGGGPRQNSSFSDTGRLRDRDLQRIVNGLWQSGAEAVAINGQRLTALSAIRAAGDAILVDNKPLPPPYTVLAVGDGQRLSTVFQDSVDGRYLRALHENFEIRWSISAQGELRLPAAPSLVVRSASPPPKAGAAGASEPGTGKGTS
ncbi:membrane protein [Wenjunlia tyrosinilytica]|uniref:Membrane protein n=2 Tax=Wenjunlia tyrosinilytica TaxID=1544741 RepID=A0A918DVW9_9ACTN|nr:membrane protein [Wenjunlia tyrosinilytica]